MLSGVGTPLRNFVMESWSSFLTEVYIFWRLAFLISLGGKSSSFLTFFGPKLGLFFLGSLLCKICFSGSSFLTFFGPKLGLFFTGSLLSKICFSGTFSPAPLLPTFSLLSRRGGVL